jgi:predicted flap endonuclease-1-like 5' DNA nuclease
MADKWVEVNSFPTEADASEPTNGESDPEAVKELAADLRAAVRSGAVTLPGDEDTLKKLHQIFDLEDEVDRCEADYLAKAESAKTAKKCLEAAQDSLNRFIRKLKEKLPLFDRDASEGKPEPLNEEPWRDDSIRELDGLSDSVFDLMEEAGLFTIGQLCDWRKSHELIELRGIGAAKVTKIEDALELFWAQEVSR